MPLLFGPTTTVTPGSASSTELPSFSVKLDNRTRTNSSDLLHEPLVPGRLASRIAANLPPKAGVSRMVEAEESL